MSTRVASTLPRAPFKTAVQGATQTREARTASPASANQGIRTSVERVSPSTVSLCPLSKQESQRQHASGTSLSNESSHFWPSVPGISLASHSRSAAAQISVSVGLKLRASVSVRARVCMCVRKYVCRTQRVRGKLLAPAHRCNLQQCLMPIAHCTHTCCSLMQPAAMLSLMNAYCSLMPIAHCNLQQCFLYSVYLLINSMQVYSIQVLAALAEIRSRLSCRCVELGMGVCLWRYIALYNFPI